jgi:hypothetical protein
VIGAVPRQEGKGTGRVRSKDVPYCGISGGAEHDGRKTDIREVPHAPMITDFGHGEADQKSVCR